MTNLEKLTKLVEEARDIRSKMAIAKAAPENARKELSGALIGHKNWDGYGLREIRWKDLHDRAIASVTDYLVNDLAERKGAELAALADRLDQIRQEIAQLAEVVRFDLLDDVRAARTWKP